MQKLTVQLNHQAPHKIMIGELDISHMVRGIGFKIELDEDCLPIVSMQMRAHHVEIDGREVSYRVKLPGGVDPSDPEAVEAWLDELRAIVLSPKGVQG